MKRGVIARRKSSLFSGTSETGGFVTGRELEQPMVDGMVLE